MIQSLKSKSLYAIKKYIVDKYPYTLNYQMKDKSTDLGELETYFVSEDGRKLPVYKHHRYNVRKAWAFYGPLSALRELMLKGLTSNETNAFFKEAIGHRTITKPFEEIRAHLAPYIKKHANLFVSDSIPDLGKRLMIPTPEETDAAIARKTKEHRNLIYNINQNTQKKLMPGDKVLEIGYVSGGESVIGFEKCGFQAVGLDNYYNDSLEATYRYTHVVKNSGSKSTFLKGDITAKTEMEEGSIDLIYSLSVLEHIPDLEKAFKEMYRILKPGAVMFHRYDPFFHILGGHATCTLDFPWGHLRLSDDDVVRYMKELMPHEASVALPWVKNALNRNHAQSNVLRLLINAGFKVSIWQNSPIEKSHELLLDSNVISECIKTNNDKGLVLSDLNSLYISFLAEKPA